MSDLPEPYARVREQLRAAPRRWLVTGAAGFIGSHLAQALLELGQTVVGLDNFATGRRRNLDPVRAAAGTDGRFEFVEGDVRDLESCRGAVAGIDVVLHQAALGSVPRSLQDPLETNAANVTGFLNLLVAARDAGVRRFVYAASSSTYGDDPGLPKVEERIGRPLSPYAVSKYIDELYADVFHRAYGIDTIGLRYFNVFGPRQDPDGAYAAVIPAWIGALLRGRPCRIYGDGQATRDFCYVANVVQANLLAAAAEDPDALNQVYNVALGGSTTVRALFEAIRHGLARGNPALAGVEPEHAPARPGDVRHSQADIRKIRQRLGYHPTHDVARGLDEALEWYVRDLSPRRGAAAVPAAAL